MRVACRVQICAVKIIARLTVSKGSRVTQYQKKLGTGTSTQHNTYRCNPETVPPCQEPGIIHEPVPRYSALCSAFAVYYSPWGFLKPHHPLSAKWGTGTNGEIKVSPSPCHSLFSDDYWLHVCGAWFQECLAIIQTVSSTCSAQNRSRWKTFSGFNRIAW